MYLREIRIRLSENYKPKLEPPFSQTLHHVREIYMTFLPQKFTLDGSSLLQIFCGPIDDKLMHPSALGITNYYVKDFDFVNYYKINHKEKEQTIIKIIESTMLDIIHKSNASIDKSIILNASKAIEQCQCQLKIHIKKLSREYPKSNLKVDVYRNLSYKDGECWTLELKSKDTILYEGYLHQCPGYIDRRSYFNKSLWDNSYFLVFDKFKKEVYRFDLAKP
jgi:hypothetical protein